MKNLELHINEKPKLRKDWVTYVAVSLFIAMVILEAVVVITLPVLLHSQKLWARESLLDKMITNRDIINSHWLEWDKKYSNEFDRSNGEMIRKSLNDITRFVDNDVNQELLTVEQIRDIMQDLARLDKIIYNARRRKIYVKFEDVEVDQYIQRLKSTCERNKTDYPYLDSVDEKDGLKE